jgi:UPF0042 nucleotide-binding protein
MPSLIVSFGFKYGGPNSADGLVIDIRRWFNRNPYRLKNLRYMRGTDQEVASDVESTPGFVESYKALFAKVANSTEEIVFLGCTAGHHRSVYLAERMAQELGAAVMHRDFDKK